MIVKLKFSLTDPSGNVTSTGGATIELRAEDIILAPSSGGPINISLRDIESIQESEYRILMRLRSEMTLTLSGAGFKHDDLVRFLFRASNELEMKDLLMGERLVKQGIPADAELLSPSKSESLGRCEVRLYETAILVMPERRGLVRLRLRDMVSAEISDFVLSVTMESGEVLRLIKLGRELDPLRIGIVDTAKDILSSAQAMVRDAYPQGDMVGVLRVAEMLKDGKTAKLDELERSCPGIWGSLEMALAGRGLGEEYAFLKSRSRQDLIRIGMKRPLHAEEAKDYMFFLAPIFSSDRKQGGNAIAFEASSEEGEGRATYFFRAWGREEYRRVGEEGMSSHADAVCQRIAIGLEAINFRREPVYLSEEALHAPEKSSYRYAIQRIPQLRLLRERFIGRVVHTSPEQWRQDIDSLLEFNTAAIGDSAVWRKADE